MANTQNAGAAAIVRTAYNLAWPEGDPHNYWSPNRNMSLVMTPTPALRAAVKKWGALGPGHAFSEATINTENYVSQGASCDVFAGTVIREALNTSDVPMRGPGIIGSYLAAHKDEWQKINYSNNVSVLQPGDVMVRSSDGVYGHIQIVAGMNGNSPIIAEAENQACTGLITSSHASLYGFQVYRYIGNAVPAGGGGGTATGRRVHRESEWLGSTEETEKVEVDSIKSSYSNFDRQYRVAAGPAGGTGFKIGAETGDSPVPLHIEFAIQKSDLETQNTGKLSIWNLNREHLSVLCEKDCALSLRAGYGSRLSLIFAGIVSYIKTSLDGADRKTEIEVVDNLVEIRDTFVSVSYNGVVNWKTIFDDVAAQMGVAVSYSYNADFVDISNGFSFVGLARDIMTKGCQCCGLVWSIQNGVMQVKRPGDVMSREVYILSPETGLINIPAQVSIEQSTSAGDTNAAKQLGWEVEYLLNGSINIDDYVRLESKLVTGYFRVNKLEISGDNQSGDWLCKAQLLEVTES